MIGGTKDGHTSLLSNIQHAMFDILCFILYFVYVTPFDVICISYDFLPAYSQ